MPKILVIEDEPDQNKLIKLRLEARGYRVLSVGKAREGIEAAKKERPDLILMDMILPDMHGLDAAIKLKQGLETRYTPVIGLSAVGSPDFIKTCLQEGIVAYVRKPYDPRDLFKTIEKFIRPEKPEKKEPGRPEPEKARASPRPGVEKPRAYAPPEAERARAYARQLADIEREFKRAPASAGAVKPRARPREAPEGRRIDDLLKGALADLPIPEKFKLKPETGRLSGRAAQSRRTAHILVVDDDGVFVQAVTDHLGERGYEISLAGDGIRALRQAFERRPDLILLNLVLPGGGGEQVLANLHKSPETDGIPIFIMSSLLSARKLEEKARELGAQGFISKPIEPEDLLYIIESVVGE
jgi:CheY-like chemotaxis protein